MVLLFILVGLLSVGITFYSGSTAIGASLGYFIFVGCLLSVFLGNNFQEKKRLLSLFFITFIGYFSYAFLMWLDFLDFGFFQFPDQIHFF